MREFSIKLTVIAISITLVTLALEIALRLNPALIEHSKLYRFHPTLRAEIAARIGWGYSISGQIITGDRLITPDKRYDGGPPLALYEPNTNYPQRVTPADAAFGAIEDMQTDSIGFCNPAGLIDRGPMDIVTLAGSIPNCTRVLPEQIFTAVLGNMTGLKSYNLGVGGQGPYEYNEILQRFGPRLRPRVVIMMIGEGNDILDCLRYLEFQETSRSRWGGLLAVSYALAFLKTNIETISAKPLERLTTFNRRKAAANFRYTVTVQGQPVPMNRRNKTFDQFTLMARKISPQVYEAPLMRFAKLAREMNFVPLVALVPAPHTVYDESILFENDSAATTIRNLNIAERNWLVSNAERIGIKFLDATPHMRKAAQTRPLLYFPVNLHLTAEGHAALAEAVTPMVNNLLAGQSKQN